MPKSAITDADVRDAFARIEEELIASMVRNLSRHRAEEAEYGFKWAQWQALQLESLDAYVRGNARRCGPAFDAVNARMEDAIRAAYADGGAKAEAGILEAIRRGWSPPAHHGGAFFSVNSRRLDALVAATRRDMMRAEHAVLRKAADEYRKVVFTAQVYAASGAGTYEKAVDMATDDMLRRGLACVTYSNGSVHTASEYAGMAVRTAVKRATFAGDGDMRRDWGVHTVVVNNRSDACAECMEWAGQVLVDDVYSGGTAAEARQSDYPLLSEAMDAGLFHPNCKDTMSTWFPDVSEEPRERTEGEKEAAEEREYLERAESAAESNTERYRRLSEYSLDDTKRERYAALADEWAGRKAAVQERAKHELSNGRIAYSQPEIDEVIERQLPNLRFPVKPEYSPRLRQYGLTVGTERIPHVPEAGYKIKSIKIGPQKNGSEYELLDTLLHELLEARMMIRGDKRLAGGDATVHPHIDRVIAKYAKLRAWKK